MKTRIVAVAARASVGVSAVLGCLNAAGYIASWFRPIRFEGLWVIFICMVFPLAIANSMMRRHLKLPRTSDPTPPGFARVPVFVFSLFVLHFFWLLLATEGGRIDDRAPVPLLFTSRTQSRALTTEEYRHLKNLQFRCFSTNALCFFLLFGSQSVGILRLIARADQEDQSH